MSKLFSLMILPMVLIGGDGMKNLYDFIFTSDVQSRCNKQPIDNYSKMYSQPDYVYRNLLPQNVPRGSNIGVCNFKKI